MINNYSEKLTIEMIRVIVADENREYGGLLCIKYKT